MGPTPPWVRVGFACEKYFAPGGEHVRTAHTASEPSLTPPETFLTRRTDRRWGGGARPRVHQPPVAVASGHQPHVGWGPRPPHQTSLHLHYFLILFFRILVCFFSLAIEIFFSTSPTIAFDDVSYIFFLVLNFFWKGVQSFYLFCSGGELLRN